ncbi:MAG: trehalose-6-phosphate synthase [Geminicoccaceae bacterium]
MTGTKFRYAVAAAFAGFIIVAALVPSITAIIEQWATRDVEARSELVANTVRDQVGLLHGEGESEQLARLFEHLTLDEKLLAVGFCDAEGKLLYPTRLMPSSFSCGMVGRSDESSFSTFSADGRPLMVGSFPVNVRDAHGHLVILHDLSFAEQRGAEARRFILLVLGGVGLTGAALAAGVSLLITRSWLRSVRKAIENVRVGEIGAHDLVSQSPLGRELEELLRELKAPSDSLEVEQLHWTPDSLRLVQTRELPGVQVIVASNREPYIHNRTLDGDITMQTPASGLVAAVEPIMRACGGTWVAHGSGTADRAVVDIHDCIAVPPAEPSYKLRRIWISEEEQDGYYYGFANEGLWPLCHLAFVRPVFRQQNWDDYRAVNRRFADAVVGEARSEDPVVLVHDYHLALVPRMVRERLPRATIITFWHVPWPNAESFGICPWREEILDGLLGSSILGLHTQFHCNNFFDTVDRFLQSRIDREYGSIALGAHETAVRPYPISIAWPPPAAINQPPVPACRKAVLERLQLGPEVRLGVGIERFDYTKGILDRLYAVDEFLNANPQWRGRFVFVQAAAPTRSKLAAYRTLQEAAVDLAADINRRHRVGEIEPIRLLIRHFEPEEVFELFRAADFCIVSSLHDGMNLVAKEFVAARDDERGVLILSTFTGAARELTEALIVNPYDAGETARAIARALTMEAGEQQERMRQLRRTVRSRNVYRWAGQMMLDAARLRRRDRILQAASRYRSAHRTTARQADPGDGRTARRSP